MEVYANPHFEGRLTSDEELGWLYNLALEMDSIVEIGSWVGASTHALCSGCKGSVYAVDDFRGSSEESDATYKPNVDDIAKRFKQNVGMMPNLHHLAMGSIEASKLFVPRSIDMIFIDAEHIYEAVYADLTSWIPIAKKVVCGHDYGFVGVNRALEAVGLWSKVRRVGYGSMWKVEL